MTSCHDLVPDDNMKGEDDDHDPVDGNAVEDDGYDDQVPEESSLCPILVWLTHFHS